MPDGDTDTSVHDVAPGAHLRTMAELLNERGYDVRGPAWKEGRRLTITNCMHARSRVEVADSGCVAWEYVPWTGSHTEPAAISGMVLRLLGIPAAEPGNQYADLHRHATFKGAIGREMNARGLTVKMGVFEDELFYTVDAEVRITNPEKPERGAVYITDDGFIRWECDSEEIPGHAVEVADTIASVLVVCPEVPISECVT